MRESKRTTATGRAHSEERPLLRSGWTPRKPVFARDHDGRAIALVPLAGNGGVARLFREDYQAIRAAGLSGQWYASSGGYVVMNLPHPPGWRPYLNASSMNVARLVARAQPGWIVTYRDRDPLNLRRDNLRLRRRRGAILQRREEAGSCIMEELDQNSRPGVYHSAATPTSHRKRVEVAVIDLAALA